MTDKDLTPEERLKSVDLTKLSDDELNELTSEIGEEKMDAVIEEFQRQQDAAEAQQPTPKAEAGVRQAETPAPAKQRRRKPTSGERAAVLRWLEDRDHILAAAALKSLETIIRTGGGQDRHDATDALSEVLRQKDLPKWVWFVVRCSLDDLNEASVGSWRQTIGDVLERGHKIAAQRGKVSGNVIRDRLAHEARGHLNHVYTLLRHFRAPWAFKTLSRLCGSEEEATRILDGFWKQVEEIEALLRKAH